MLRIFLLALGLSACLAAQSAKGTLTVNGQSYELKHAYAFQVPDWTDKSKMGVAVLVTDREVPEKILNHKMNPFDLRDAGVNGLKMEFYDDGGGYSMNLVGTQEQASVSISGTFDKERFRTLTAERIDVSLDQEEKKLGSTSLQYKAEFAADIVPYVETPKYVPNDADIAAAKNAASTKAYLAFHEAMKKGDLTALRGMVVPERAAMMDAPNFKEMFEFVQEMMAKDVKVLKATEEGDAAELILTGTMMDKEDAMGKVSLMRINGKWLVANESWGDE